MNLDFARGECPSRPLCADKMAGFAAGPLVEGSADGLVQRGVHGFAPRWALGVLLACTHVACASVNQTPLSDAAKAPRLSYLYGPAEEGAVAFDQPTEEDASFEMAENDADELEDEDEEDSSDDLEVSVVIAGEDEEEGGEEGSEKPSPFAPGTYKGTDWVTISLPGLPEDEQVDDAARVVLTALGKPNRYSFAVLDTRTGDELCEIEGTAKNTLIAFDEDQTCFAGILGVPMEATMTTGIATISGGELSVSLSVELSVNTPNGELSGELDYRFEGKKQ